MDVDHFEPFDAKPLLADLDAAQAEARAGSTVDATRDYKHSLALYHDDAVAQNSLGVLLLASGQLIQALGHFDAALQIRPDYAAAYYNEALVMQRKRRLTEAIIDLQKAVSIQPDFESACSYLAYTLVVARRYSEAVNAAKSGLARFPKHRVLLISLARAEEGLGHLKRAVADYQQCLVIDPRYFTALTRLAWIHATAFDPSLLDGPLALKEATRACDLTGNQDPSALDALAAAYARCARYRRAVETAQAAEHLARPGYRTRIVARRKLYEGMLPYQVPEPGQVRASGLSGIAPMLHRG